MANKTCGDCNHFSLTTEGYCRDTAEYCHFSQRACSNFEQKIITNGDKIHQKCNEELAEIKSKLTCELCASYDSTLRDENKALKAENEKLKSDLEIQKNLTQQMCFEANRAYAEAKKWKQMFYDLVDKQASVSVDPKVLVIDSNPAESEVANGILLTREEIEHPYANLTVMIEDKRRKAEQMHRTVFARITQSPEVLAPKFVEMMYDRVSGDYRHYSVLTGEFYNSDNEALTATVEKLKEMEK